MEQLSKVLIKDSRSITFISDRNEGILQSVAKVFPTCYHSYCLQHLKNNVRDKFSGKQHSNEFRDKVEHKFVECAYAPTVDLFIASYNELLKYGKSKIESLFVEAPVTHWANAFFQSKRYG